tara:strand:- start:253 stop:996 length:744 start_codon:yes stop_codon:yes gene_type:complete
MFFKGKPMLYLIMLITHANAIDWKDGLLTKPLSKDLCEQQFKTCSCDSTKLDTCVPEYEATIAPISEELKAKIIGKSWHEGCPLPIKDISTVQLMHWTPEGEIHWGHINIASVEAENVAKIFSELYESHFPITSIKLIHEFNGSDDASMKVNNTSGFNCRPIKNTKRWSQHSYGQALDINPLWNPWVRGTIIDPPEGKEFVDRSNSQLGLIRAGDSTVLSFEKYGWKWGGYWSNGRKDYQHFSTSGK